MKGSALLAAAVLAWPVAPPQSSSAVVALAFSPRGVPAAARPVRLPQARRRSPRQPLPLLNLSPENKQDEQDEVGKESASGEATPTPASSPVLFATPEEAAAESLAEQARRAALEAERMEAELTLAKIGKLENQLKTIVDGEDGAEKDRMGLREEIEALAKKIDPGFVGVTSAASNENDGAAETAMLASKPPPAGLTAAALEDACEYFVSLPITMRSALADAVGYDKQESLTGLEVREVVSRLYERRDSLSAAILRERYQDKLQAPLTLDKGMEELLDEVKNMMENPDEMRLEAAVDTQLPRQARREGTCPTESDVNAFFTDACGRDTFQPAEKPIRAGEVWVIRGKNKKKDAAALVKAVDEALERSSPDWAERNQWCYIMDPSLEEGEEDVFGDPVILIVNRDMAPTITGFVTTASSLAALSGAFLFCLGTFGSNPVIMDRLREANEAGNYDLGWFNELIFPLLASFAAIQASHELAHLAVAWRDKLKVTPPTILPSLGLPYLSFLSRMKTSPKNYQSLFDFGFAGPVSGMGVSFGFLLLGLQLTASLDQEAVKVLPSLPVGFVKLSSLGGTLVDQFVGGGTGILLDQDPSTVVPLHPFAIAGFVGMMINALDLIPIGSTDGARMSQSILGRVGQTVVGGFAYIVLLFALIFLDQRDIFLSYCLVNTLVQRDLEIPCQNEVDRVELGRAAAALAAWFVAALVIIPM